MINPQLSRQPYVIAVVLNYNGYEDTVKCIQSLQNVTYQNLGIVLVDNGSPDGSGERLKKDFPDIPIMLLMENTGYAAGNNAGIRFALKKKADYVLVLNNDVIVDREFLGPMVDVAEKNSEVGIVNCKVYYQSSHTEIFAAAGKMNWWLCTGVNTGNLVKAFQNNDAQCYTDFACGVLLLMRKSMLESEGMFDEKYFMYFEDVEYSRRILKKYKIAYTPSGIAYHKSGGGKGWKSYTNLYLYFHTRNRLWVFKDDPVIYRLYVIFFSLVNVGLKTVVLSSNIDRNYRGVSGQIKSLWRGFIDGLTKNSRINKFRTKNE